MLKITWHWLEVTDGSSHHSKLMEDGWEPFQIIKEGAKYRVFLRKQIAVYGHERPEGKVLKDEDIITRAVKKPVVGQS